MARLLSLVEPPGDRHVRDSSFRASYEADYRPLRRYFAGSILVSFPRDLWLESRPGARTEDAARGGCRQQDDRGTSEGDCVAGGQWRRLLRKPST
jgi:hypothetical protein